MPDHKMGFDPIQQAESDHTPPGSGLTADLGIVVAIFAVAALGGLISGGSSDPWYAELTKAPGTPPGYVFGIVWPILYILMGISAVIVRHSARRFEWAGAAFALFFSQLGLNLAWSVLFFFFHKPLWALIDIAALWVAVALMIRSFAPWSKFAAAIQLPYLCWLSFATYLNAGVIFLNGPNGY